jgi:hypothetical protein|tara:strand:- start:8883 stop:9554 length:672 start_codon:yes stop_codon:yes gene_type:complete
MRSQIYEWNSQTGTAATSWTNSQSGNSVSIFIGGFGNNITKPAETTATQFVVIEDVAVSPTAFLVSGTASVGAYYRGLEEGGPVGGNGVYGNRAYIQIRINTTDYFLDPDNVGNDGIPGAASPYPRSTDFQPCFNLYPDVYVLPGQVFDALVTCYQNSAFADGATAPAKESSQLYAFMKYTLYDGPDALIANKLLEMGISINPGNVDWYKRTLIQSQSAPAMA